MKEAGAYVTLGIIKAVVGFYGIITLPLYFIIQQPWKKWRKKNEIWAAPVVKGDPSSSYIRLKGVEKEVLPEDATVDTLFRNAVKDFKDRLCYGTREVFGDEEQIQPDGKVVTKLILGDFKWMTFEEVGNEVEQVARSLVLIGVKPKEPVLLFAETRVEWMIVAQAVFRLGGQVATLYATLGESGIIHGINETGVSVVVTSYSLLPKLQNISSQIPHVKTIIYMEGLRPPSLTNFPNSIKVLSYSQFKAISDIEKDAIISYQPPVADDIAVIMYTSGSTGTPKGVLLTHRNVLVIVRTFHMVTDHLKKTISNEALEGVNFVGYLPLAHSFELASELTALTVGVPTGYSSPQTLIDNASAIKEGQKGDLALIKPDLMIAVPLLLDRILKSVKEVTAKRGLISKWFFNYAVSYKTFWMNLGFSTPLMDRIVFSKIHRLLGGRLKYIATGGAALSPDTHRFTEACLGVCVFQGYGMTETAGAGTVADLDDADYDTVGAPSLGTQIRLLDWEEGGYHVTDKPYPRGEILIGGISVSPGYYKKEELTKETFFTENGVRWCRTGDIGLINHKGTLKIIDRRKDLVKLQHGEYVSLSKIETMLKTCLLVDNICAIGLSHATYIVALVIPNQKQLQQIAEDLGKTDLSFRELCDDVEVSAAAVNIIRKHANRCNMYKTEIPRKMKLCADEWLPETGLVTPTFKLKRAAIQKFYDDIITKMYDDGIGEMNGTSKTPHK